MNGPASYQNWKRQIDNAEPQGGYETPVFTDGRVLGMVFDGYGPYQFLNASGSDERLGVARPAVVLRVQLHGKFTPPDFQTTDDSAYHAGWLDDELAAVVSLTLGIRAHAGDRTRQFGVDDSRGLPCGAYWRPDPVITPFRGPSVIPSAAVPRNLDLLEPFRDFQKLDPPAAIAVIRAARLYQQGLWVAQSEQNLTWLLFTSAIETAANFWRGATDDPVDRIRAWKPKLAERLMEVGGGDFLAEVAAVIGPVAGGTKKFLDFLLTFLPDPPAPRPPTSFQVDWSTRGLKAAFSKVYDYRSHALHVGIPFPQPMGWAPQKVGEVYAEKQVGSAGSGVHIWNAKDLPIQLNTFEYVVRHSLLNWWKSLPRARTE